MMDENQPQLFADFCPVRQTGTPHHFRVDQNPPRCYNSANGQGRSPQSRRRLAQARGNLASLPDPDQLSTNPKCHPIYNSNRYHKLLGRKLFLTLASLTIHIPLCPISRAVMFHDFQRKSDGSHRLIKSFINLALQPSLPLSVPHECRCQDRLAQRCPLSQIRLHHLSACG